MNSKSHLISAIVFLVFAVYAIGRWYFFPEALQDSKFDIGVKAVAIVTPFLSALDFYKYFRKGTADDN